jgi:hypothetical protein
VPQDPLWRAPALGCVHAFPEATRVTLVWVKVDGDWRLAGIHFSFIAAAPSSAGPF